jgi:ribosome-binding protein aMBF1 (putative translation factor)
VEAATSGVTGQTSNLSDPPADCPAACIDRNFRGCISRSALQDYMDTSQQQQRTSYRAFGRAIRELRARRGISQEDLGFASSLHRNYVDAVERGEINPTMRTIVRLAIGLRIRPSELVALAEQRHTEMTAEDVTDEAP